MGDGISLFLVPKGTGGLAIRLLPSVDETRKLCELRLDRVSLPATALIGELHGGWPPLARVLDRAAVAAMSASTPLPSLPTEFHGDRIILQMVFAYNMPTN